MHTPQVEQVGGEGKPRHRGADRRGAHLLGLRAGCQHRAQRDRRHAQGAAGHACACEGCCRILGVLVCDAIEPCLGRVFTSSARGSTPTKMCTSYSTRQVSSSPHDTHHVYPPCLQIWWKTQSPAGCTAGISDRLWWGPESTLTKDPAFNYNGTVDSHQHAFFFNRDAWTKARMRQHEVCALVGVCDPR